MIIGIYTINIYDKYLDPDNEMFNKEMYIRQKNLEVYNMENNEKAGGPKKLLNEKISKINDEYVYDADVERLDNDKEFYKVRLVMINQSGSMKATNYYGFDNLSLFLGKYSEGGDAIRGPEYYGDPTDATGDELKELQRKQLINLL